MSRGAVRLGAFCVAALLGTVCHAGQMFDDRGQAIPASEPALIATAEPTSTPAAPPQPLGRLLDRLAAEAAEILRQEDDPTKTTLQRQALRRERVAALQRCLDPLTGRRVLASLVVEDVIPREPPPVPIHRTGVPDETREAALRTHRAIKEEVERHPVLVIARLTPPAPAGIGDELTAEERAQIAKITEDVRRERQKLLRMLAEAGTDLSREALRENLRENDRRGREWIAAVRRKAAGDPPAGGTRVYVLGSYDDFETWVRGERRTVLSEITSVGLFPGPNKPTAVEIEAALQLTPIADPGADKAPATRPAPTTR